MILNFKYFLIETQQRIDGIKKAHIPSIAKMLNGKSSHDHTINSVYSDKFVKSRDDYIDSLNKEPHTPITAVDFENHVDGLHQKAAEHAAGVLIDTAAKYDPDQLKHKHTECRR